MAGFNSQVPHFMQKVSVYCAKVLPLVFDNSLSYYEFLCKMCHKLNEAIDAINAQNLNIIEFTKMVELEISKFEEYMEKRQQEFEDDMKAQWEDFKSKLEAEWQEFKKKLEDEWEAEKLKNEQFRQDMLKNFEDFKSEMKALQGEFEKDMKEQWQTFKDTVNSEIEQFESTVTNNFGDFKNLMQTQLNEFENHMVSLFEDFTTDFNKSWSEFQDSMYNSITNWESQTETKLTTFINEKFTEQTAKLEERLADLQKEINELVTASGVLFKASDYATTIPNAGGVYYPSETTQEPVFPNLIDNMPLSYYWSGYNSNIFGEFCMDENNQIRLNSMAPIFYYREKAVGTITAGTPRVYNMDFQLSVDDMPSWCTIMLQNAGTLPILTGLETTDTENIGKINITSCIRGWDRNTSTLSVSIILSATETVTIAAERPWYFLACGYAIAFGAPKHQYLPIGVKPAPTT